MTTFGCSLNDDDLTRACAPEQPDSVEVGQNWMRLSDGNTLPVKSVRGEWIDLGGAFLTVVMSEQRLREDYVCIDPLDNVRRIAG